MIAERFEAADDVIQPVAEHAKRPVGAVRAGVNKWCAPEVVVQQLIPWLTGVHHIGIAENRSSVNGKEEEEKK